MNERLVNYLQDNRDFIIENWLTEADLPPPEGASSYEGSAPVAFLEGLFERVIDRISGRASTCRGPNNDQEVTFKDVLGVTCVCQTHRLRGHVCLELHEAGIRAFDAVFNDHWDSEREFNEFDRELGLRVINESLSWIFSQEIFHCPHRVGKEDCPFTLN